jgi:MoaA/NifB/PqqE/SkfB family radical SAM enzyme
MILRHNLIFFVTSKCNVRCKHCFYWKNLNQCEDLTCDQINAMCGGLKGLHRVSLSGGEPFLRDDLFQICRAFDRIAGAGHLAIPTNGSLPEKIYGISERILKECRFKGFNINLSLDGLEQDHDFIRGRGSFGRVLETYRLLKPLKDKYKNFGMSVSTTVMDVNIGSLSGLTRFIYGEMPGIDRHNLTLLRGDTPSKEVGFPQINKIEELFRDVLDVWKGRMSLKDRVVKRLLYVAQLDILRCKLLKIPCKAGILCGVVYDNGDVCFCEFDKPIGNVKNAGFREIWNSNIAGERRDSIKQKRCLCTHECFLEPSILRAPLYIIKNLIGFLR